MCQKCLNAVDTTIDQAAAIEEHREALNAVLDGLIKQLAPLLSLPRLGAANLLDLEGGLMFADGEAPEGATEDVLKLQQDLKVMEQRSQRVSMLSYLAGWMTTENATFEDDAEEAKILPNHVSTRQPLFAITQDYHTAGVDHALQHAKTGSLLKEKMN